MWGGGPRQPFCKSQQFSQKPFQASPACPLGQRRHPLASADRFGYMCAPENNAWPIWTHERPLF